MYHKRLDKGCESKILAVDEQTVLIEARWPIGAKQQQRNIVNVPVEYFERKYGQTPRIN
jgi:hypothetical protein